MPAVRPDPASRSGKELVAGRPGIRRRLEDDEVPLAEAARDLARRVEHDREIGLSLLGERRRQRDQDRVGLREDVVVGCRVEPALVDEPPEQLRWHVLDVALTAEDLLDPVLADVDQDNAATRVGEDLGEGKPHVAGADDRDVERANRQRPWRRRGRSGPRRGIVPSAASESELAQK